MQILSRFAQTKKTMERLSCASGRRVTGVDDGSKNRRREWRRKPGALLRNGKTTQPLH